MHKSVAVQKALLDNPRISREVAIVQMLCGHYGIKLVVHKSLWQEIAIELAEKVEPLYNKLGLSSDVMEYICRPHGLYCNGLESINIYEALKCLTDQELEAFHLNLTVLCFGQYSLDKLDTDPNSLFNRVAQDLGVDMRAHWKPDETFLKRRNVQQISDILIESGLDKIIGNGKGNKKSTLIEAVIKQFTRLQEKD
ncbi:MAG: hypothetical protein MI743_08775, partial [Sneathiellales bacterium]|nr:hypothetical protein [Sneathiellales bacterium]